jgi:hypothetical protein
MGQSKPLCALDFFVFPLYLSFCLDHLIESVKLRNNAILLVLLLDFGRDV